MPYRRASMLLTIWSVHTFDRDLDGVPSSGERRVYSSIFFKPREYTAG